MDVHIKCIIEKKNRFYFILSGVNPVVSRFQNWLVASSALLACSWFEGGALTIKTKEQEPDQ